MEQPVTFISEIGMNHNGNFGLLYELIKQSKKSGAHIAKFQLGWRCGPDEINALDEEAIAHIIETCGFFEIKPMFSIITDGALDLAEKFDFDCFKIASRTVEDNPALIEKVLAKKKKTFISLGKWQKDGVPFEKQDQISYLWCKFKYPAYPWDLLDLPKDFQTSKYDGYSDHSVGIDIPLMAIARGAKVIEKHFTLDKSDTTIRDHALSATPDEFAQLTEIGTLIAKNCSIGV